jgi:hypothetical protein
MKKDAVLSPTPEARRNAGSALLMAVFVLFLVSSMGVALLFTSSTEVKMSQAGLRTKEAFFLAEAAVEDARTDLWLVNDADTFDDDLIAAASDGTMDFDPTAVRPVYGTDGEVTGLTGYGNDVPLVALKQLGEGWYAAFLTNDPGDTTGGPLDDENDRVMITGVGAGPDRSFEVVQAILLLQDLLPSAPPATITLLGPNANFLGGNSKVKDYEGEDCGGLGDPNIFVPVVGVIDDASETNAESGWDTNPDYQSGSNSDLDVFANLNDATEPTVISSTYGTLDPAWQDCENMRAMIELYRFRATTLCTSGPCVLPNDITMTPQDIVFVDGDLAPPPNWNGQGTLVVTGTMTYAGTADFNGLILVVGQGIFVLNGAGNGTISGGLIVADIAGPDNLYGTADDCTGPDNGFDVATYDESGGGNGLTQYCTVDLNAEDHSPPYDVIEFLQC